MKIIDIDLQDLNRRLDNGIADVEVPDLGSIQIIVETDRGYLCYQTTNTFDYGAVSLTLAATEESSGDDFSRFTDEEREEIRKIVQPKFDEYVQDTYEVVRLVEIGRGIDGNSYLNECKRK